MKNKEIEKIINQEFQDVYMPSNKEELMRDIQNIQQLRPDKKTKIRLPCWKYKISILAIICVIFMTFIKVTQTEQYSVAFEVNPSIELTINDQRRVKKVICHNEDAQLVMDDMDLLNTDLDVAINALIGSMFKYGYITEINNSILVSVQGKNQETRKQLKQEIAGDVKNILSGYSIDASVVSQDYDFSKEREKLAKTYNISVGKVTLIQKLIEKSSNYDFEDLVHLSISDLNTLIHYKNINFKTVTIDGVKSHNGYLTSEEAKQEALTHAQVNESNIKEYYDDLNVKNNQLIYVIKFKDEYAMYQYIINAVSGEIISFEVNL